MPKAPKTTGKAAEGRTAPAVLDHQRTGYDQPPRGRAPGKAKSQGQNEFKLLSGKFTDDNNVVHVAGGGRTPTVFSDHRLDKMFGNKFEFVGGKTMRGQDQHQVFDKDDVLDMPEYLARQKREATKDADRSETPQVVTTTGIGGGKVKTPKEAKGRDIAEQTEAEVEYDEELEGEEAEVEDEEEEDEEDAASEEEDEEGPEAAAAQDEEEDGEDEGMEDVTEQFKQAQKAKVKVYDDGEGSFVITDLDGQEVRQKPFTKKQAETFLEAKAKEAKAAKTKKKKG